MNRNRRPGAVEALALALASYLAGPSSALGKPPEPLVFEDQFDRKQDMASYRGSVVVLVYGDRKGAESCRDLGADLHILFHPSARGLPPRQARREPTAPLAGAPADGVAPEVVVLPVACTGRNIPRPIRSLIKAQLRKVSPDVPVLLDFDDLMATRQGLTPGQTNVAVLGVDGSVVAVERGTLDRDRLAAVIEGVRQARQAGLAAAPGR